MIILKDVESGEIIAVKYALFFRPLDRKSSPRFIEDRDDLTLYHWWTVSDIVYVHDEVSGVYWASEILSLNGEVSDFSHSSDVHCVECDGPMPCTCSAPEQIDEEDDNFVVAPGEHLNNW